MPDVIFMEQALAVRSEWRANHNDVSTCRETWVRQCHTRSLAPTRAAPGAPAAGRNGGQPPDKRIAPEVCAGKLRAGAGMVRTAVTRRRL